MLKNKKKRSLTRKSLIYSIGPIASALSYLLIIPIYSKYLKPADYGNYEYTFAILTVIMGVSFLDIFFTTLRFMYGREEESERAKNVAIYSGSFLFLCSCIIFIVFILIANQIFTLHFLKYAIFFAFFRILGEEYTSFVRGKDEELLYAIGNALCVLTTLACTILLIVVLKKGAECIFISAGIGYLVQCVFYECKIKVIKNFKFEYIDKDTIILMLKFSLPLAISSIAHWFLNYYSRIVIDANLSSIENGLYGMAITLANGIPTIAGSIMLAWEEIALSKQGGKEEKEKFFSKALSRMFRVLCCCYIVYLSGIYIIFPYYVDASYEGIKILLPIVIAGTIISTLKSFTTSIFGNDIDSKPIMISAALGALCNVLVITPLITKFGVVGASLAYFLGYFVSIVFSLSWLYHKQHYKIPFWTLFYCILLSSIAGYLCSKDILAINICVLIFGMLFSIFSFREMLPKKNGRICDET